jgi:2-oxoglutarate ferredoxin oxidoreductase subunit alpha
MPSNIRFIQGNEACAEGAFTAGARYFAGYPITPSSEIAQIASQRLPQLGGCFMQMEDEIASIAAVIGASASGIKSFTATSGPGFSLMQENLGVAITGEVPCVIINVQRSGPSTGMATNPAQADLMQTRWGTHGDHSIIVLAPSSPQECYDLTIRAFNLSEKYRTPVIVLTDKTVAQVREKVKLYPPAETEIVNRKKPTCAPLEYRPFQSDTGGVPPMSYFGEPHLLRITSSMHNEDGFTDSNAVNASKVIRRLHDKIEKNVDDIAQIETCFTEDADTVFISFGISARASLHAVHLARAEGKKVGAVKLLGVWPFPALKLQAILKNCHQLIVPEMNMGQLVLEVERVFKDKKVISLTKSNGQNIMPAELLAKMKEVGVK